VDYAFIDATFYDGKELPGRDLSKIPHPFVSDTIELLKGMNDKDK
jgi:pyrroloquinoline quinone biosynthesis protein B